MLQIQPPVSAYTQKQAHEEKIHILSLISTYTFKYLLYLTRALLQAFKTSRQFRVRIREWRSLLACAPGRGKMTRDKAAFRRMHQLGIHRGMSQFSRKESDSHDSEAIYM